MKRKNILLKYLGWSSAGTFLLLNVSIFNHAYHFSHFQNSAADKTKKPEKLSLLEKAELMFTGVSLPRPENRFTLPENARQCTIKSNVNLDGWLLSPVSAEDSVCKGTIILFHGYGGEKTSMYDKALEFLDLRYNVLLVDFMGAGNSEGNICTIGFKEAEEVRDCYLFVEGLGEKEIYLFGTSMGAASIMKALHDYPNVIKPAGVLLECPFGTMLKTVSARFRRMGAPATPLAHMLVFWGGIQNGFWGFSHNPEDYARQINCNTLLMAGGKDEYVSKGEIDLIYANLQGPKRRVTFAEARHENYLTNYKSIWKQEVSDFLNQEKNCSQYE